MKSGTATSPNRVRESTRPMPIFGRRAAGLKHRRDRPPDRTLPVMRGRMVLRKSAECGILERRVGSHGTDAIRISRSRFRIHFVGLSTPRAVTYTHVVEAAPALALAACNESDPWECSHETDQPGCFPAVVCPAGDALYFVSACRRARNF